MARRQYQRQLDELRTDVCQMADLVLDRYDDALAAYETGDEALAQAVIEGDHDINERYLDLEGTCIELLALQQPVAGDLRVIASSFKIVTDLERIGDLATNIAGYGVEDTETHRSMQDLREIGETAGKMVRAAIAVYEAGTAEETWEIAARDDDLDDACRTASERLVRDLIADDPSTLTDAEREVLLADVSRTLLMIRDVERVGDHAVNICARTLYMLENDDGLIY